MGGGWGRRPRKGKLNQSRRPSGLRKTNPHYNSLAHRTPWLKIFFGANRDHAVGAAEKLLGLRSHIENVKIFEISSLNKQLANLLSKIKKKYENYKNREDSSVEGKVV